MGELSVNDSEQTEGEHLAALGISPPAKILPKIMRLYIDNNFNHC